MNIPGHSPSTRQAAARSRGLTLIELLCGLVISALLLGRALPPLLDLLQRQALASAAAMLETDVQFARSQAMVSSGSVRLTVQSLDGGGSCYMIHTGSASACRCDGGGRAQCTVGTQLLRLVEQPPAAGVQLGNAGRSILFDAGRGTVTPTATFVLTDRHGRAVHQIVNIVGRTRSCSPSGLPGYRACA